MRDGSLGAHIKYTAVLVQGGQIAEAQQAYKTLVSNYPHFPNNYQRVLDGLRISGDLYEQLLNDLTLAGLTPVL